MRGLDVAYLFRGYLLLFFYPCAVRPVFRYKTYKSYDVALDALRGDITCAYMD